ncbi:MAG: hypothetical protein WC761_00640 [Candidatus Paceibacterota bacterium]|jgi:hypothetical protein
MGRIGTTVTRQFGAAGRTDAGQRRQLATQGEHPVLQRAVVVDVITDLSLLSSDFLDQIARLVNNAELVDVMPIGSVIARIVSNQGGVGPVSHTILFPFFSSHFMLPVQPGEQVNVMYEDYAGTGAKVGYWLSRVHSEQTIEDPNYTHFDRRFDPSSNPGNYTTSQVSERKRNVPPVAFQNGGNTPDTLTLQPSGNLDENPYQTIVDSSVAFRYITPEPVPRWRKRPQEFVLQGANNALIMIGEDRNGPISGAIQQSPIDITKAGAAPRQAGAIDIVAGRGRYFPTPGENPKEGGTDINPPQTKSTSPLVATNSRQFRETDKNPFRSTREGIANSQEGDPDPIYDAARVYVVQQSKVDENYQLVRINDVGQEYPDDALAVVQPAGNGVYGRSYVVAKADNIRIIGRKEANSQIDGTVLIIREGAKATSERGGTPNSAATSNDAATSNGTVAYIYLNADGEIQQEAKRIILGRGSDEKEPYLRYTYYNVHIAELKTQIKALADQVQTITQKYNQAFLTAIAVPNSPIVDLVAIGPQVFGDTVSKVQQIKQKVDAINPADAKSKKIFGE